ncbi:MAG: rhodanese-related sulfurtransferase [Flavobacteriales bacterium]
MDSGASHHLRNLFAPELLRANLEREGVERTTLSFYRYVRLADPSALRNTLYAEWERIGVLGRVYLASEGINAQVSLPSSDVDRFRKCLDARSEFVGVPFKIALEEDAPSFIKLTIKVKKKLVADGLADDAFDVTNVGEHLSASAFNERLASGATVVDMRNNYESAIGHFEGAYLPKADKFHGALAEVLERLEDRKSDEVLLYCTGGIRCEKASAYLKHHGFTNVGQLHGGIIDYAHQVKREGLDNKFKGRNFVFDGRMAERISDDVVSACMQCGATSDRIANCMEESCNLLLVQCEACANKYDDCCSPSCREIHQLPTAVQHAWRKGRLTRSTVAKAITDTMALRTRIRAEEELLALNGTIHPELTDENK